MTKSNYLYCTYSKGKGDRVLDGVKNKARRFGLKVNDYRGAYADSGEGRIQRAVYVSGGRVTMFLFRLYTSNERRILRKLNTETAAIPITNVEDEETSEPIYLTNMRNMVFEIPTKQ